MRDLETPRRVRNHPRSFGNGRGSATRWLLALVLLVPLGLSSVCGSIVREYELKAAFLYNFIQFTEWPTNSFAQTNSPLVIGILGADPFGTVVDDTVRGESLNRHELVVERYRTIKDLKPCHALFISQSEERRLGEIVAALKGKPTLTVSDIPGAAFRGVMIEFFVENNKIRFRINLSAVKAAGLTLSSKLLRVAETVPREVER